MGGVMNATEFILQTPLTIKKLTTIEGQHLKAYTIDNMQCTHLYFISTSSTGSIEALQTPNYTEDTWKSLAIGPVAT